MSDIKIVGWEKGDVLVRFDGENFHIYDSDAAEFVLTPEELSDLYDILCEIPDDY